MSHLSLSAMRRYLSQSLSSVNQNKLNGLLAEIAFRQYLAAEGFGERITAGGWLCRSDARSGSPFGSSIVAFFPESTVPCTSYDISRTLPSPPQGLHTVCSAFHQLGIDSYFLTPVVSSDDDPLSLTWMARQLGVPHDHGYLPFPSCISGFARRSRRHPFLRYKTDTAALPDECVPDEFAKEHARISFANQYMAETVDIDGLFWGRSKTYPIEIKEKTAAEDKVMGSFFGLDLGPFVKLAFYAAKRKDLDSIFVVREIADTNTRCHVEWWFIDYERLSQCASWVPQGGGRNMLGGGSTVVKIPKSAFQRLDHAALTGL